MFLTTPFLLFHIQLTSLSIVCSFSFSIINFFCPLHSFLLSQLVTLSLSLVCSTSVSVFLNNCFLYLFQSLLCLSYSLSVVFLIFLIVFKLLLPQFTFVLLQRCTSLIFICLSFLLEAIVQNCPSLTFSLRALPNSKFLFTSLCLLLCSSADRI